MTTCLECGRESSGDARFCASCGASLSAPAAAREERKVVSVVFVDLVGHTSRSESADPEDVRAMLGPYYARVRSKLESFGGTVEKFIGDAVMAVFGAPISHEDDPERAVRAALAVRDAMIEDALEVRIAVNTGEALVSLDARLEAGEAIVAGDVVNTAARLQSAAPVNGVLVGEATHRATTRAIDYENAPAVAAKGKAALVAAWVAVAPRARFGVDVAQHGGAELVGRETERRLLWDAFERARSEQSLQVVTLIGVPGVGKSRLVWELFRQLDEEPDLTYWRQGRALAYGGGPFGAVAEAVRSHLGVLEGEGPSEIAPKLERALDELPLNVDDRAWLLRRLQPLLGMEAGESSQRGEAFAAWQRLLEGMASVRPFVLVLEDLHWADDGTLDFVDHLSAWASEVPLLIVATARPELLERRPEWGGGKLNSHTLALRPLDDRATAELLARLLNRTVIDAELQSRLLQQAGGNPLYAEEFARMVSEAGADSAVPDSVQGIIAARIDVLHPREKSLLQDAAVLGKVFWRGGLIALGADEADLDSALQRLARKEFVRREPGSIVGDDAEFAFRHALVRDAAYSQLPRAARATKHRLAAEWIAATTVARPDLVAHHFSEALEAARATGADVTELEHSAREALWTAADRARSLAAYDDALRLYERALDLYTDPDLDRARLLLELSRTANDGGTQAQGKGYGEAARELFNKFGNQAGVSGAETVLARASWAMGDGLAARDHIRQAVDAAVASGDELALAHALSARARNRSVSGQHREAIPDAEQAMELAERLGLDHVWIATMNALANAHANLGMNQWREEHEIVIERARAANAPDLWIRALNNRGHHEVRLGGPRAGVEWFGEMARIAYHYRVPFTLRWAQAVETWQAYLSGEWDAALAFAESFSAVEPGVPHYLDGQVQQARTLIHFARDHDAESEAASAATLANARRVDDLQETAPVLAFQAHRLVELGDHAGARRYLSELQALESGIENALDYGTVVAWTSVALGEQFTVDENDSRFWARAAKGIAEERLEDAIALLDEGGAVTEAAYTRLQLARRSEEPNPWLSQAEMFYRRVGATRYLRQLEELRTTRRSA